jgi:dUTP pyrophosphatase
MSDTEQPQEVLQMTDTMRAYIKEQIQASLYTHPMEGFKLYAISEEFIPVYNKVGDSGFDLRANIASTIIVQPGERVLIFTGIHTELPVGFEIQIRPRSGSANKQGATVVNAPGTIDANFRNEIGVIFMNTDPREPIEIKRGDRIAQGVVCRVERVNFEIVSSPELLSPSERGLAGFGSTGVA